MVREAGPFTAFLTFPHVFAFGSGFGSGDFAPSLIGTILKKQKKKVAETKGFRHFFALGHQYSYNSAFLTSKRGRVQGGCRLCKPYLRPSFFAEYIQLDVVSQLQPWYNLSQLSITRMLFWRAFSKELSIFATRSASSSSSALLLYADLISGLSRSTHFSCAYE